MKFPAYAGEPGGCTESPARKRCLERTRHFPTLTRARGGSGKLIACPCREAMRNAPAFAAVNRENQSTSADKQRRLLSSADRGCIHRGQEILGVAVVVGIERPHKGTAQPTFPIGVPNSEISRNGVIIGNVAVRSIGFQHVGKKCNGIIKRLPPVSVDPRPRPRIRAFYHAIQEEISDVNRRFTCGTAAAIISPSKLEAWFVFADAKRSLTPAMEDTNDLLGLFSANCQRFRVRPRACDSVARAGPPTSYAKPDPGNEVAFSDLLQRFKDFPRKRSCRRRSSTRPSYHAPLRQ